MQCSVAAQTITSQDSGQDTFLNDVLKGLNAARKTLDPKYFYNETGSLLFERITGLPEYYITRTETQIMEQAASEIGDLCEDTQEIVEFGSGSGRRSEILLGALPNVISYVPIDVSGELLESTARVVAKAYPHVRIQPLVADFTGEMQIPRIVPQRRLGYFPGSTIGNFLPADAVSFLTNARRLLGAQARMLVGVDLIKATDRLERAYDDSAGITAAFNKNILTRINEELGANFVPNHFAHQAFLDENLSRIEMHLVSLWDQQVSINGKHRINFRAGETIHTENSHKFTVEGFRRLARRAEWRPAACFVDDDRQFSVHLLEN